jgi:hypothetical protein
MDISAKSFYHFLNYFAFWKVFCQECVPSFELVKLSHYPFGKDLDKTMLGGWWKFLAMSVFVYGVLFRFLIYLLSFVLKPKEIELVSKSDEKEFKETEVTFENKSDLDTLKDREFRLLGYYVDVEKLGIKSSKNAKDIVIAVKSYEPPIMDFFDYLDEIKEENPNSKISLLMVGLDKPKEKDVKVWIRKLNELGLNDIEVLS